MRALSLVCVVAMAALSLVVVPAASAVDATQGPQIAGYPRVGQPLTAAGGTWPAAGSSTFAWYVGASRVGTGSAYTVKPANLDQVLTLVETFTGSGTDAGQTGTASVSTTPITEGDPPTPVRALSVSGAAEVGSSLVASRATFQVKGVTTLTWTVDGTRVETGRSYTVRPADLGKVVRLTQRFSSNGYAATTLAIDSAPVSLGPAPTAFQRPSVTGKPQVGTRLWVTGGTWSEPGQSSYAWSVDGVPVATGRSYLVDVDDVGSRVTVTETLTSPGYEPGVATGQSAVVAAAPVKLRLKVGKARTGRRVALVIRLSSPAGTVPGRVKVGYSGKALGKESLKGGRTSLWLPRKKQDGAHRLRVSYPGRPGFAPVTRTLMIRLR